MQRLARARARPRAGWRHAAARCLRAGPRARRAAARSGTARAGRARAPSDRAPRRDGCRRRRGRVARGARRRARPRNSSSRVGSPGGWVAAIGSTGRMPYGRPSSVSKSTGPAASGAAVASRIAETASAISAGASGTSSPAPQRGAQLDHAVAVGLATEASRQEPPRLGPVPRQLAIRRGPDADALAQLALDAGADPDERRDGHVRATLAEERALELGVGPIERLVVPVEPAAGFCDRAPGGRGARCGRARRPPTGRPLHGHARRSRPQARDGARRARSSRRLGRAAGRRDPRRSRARAADTRRARDRRRLRAPRRRTASLAGVVELAQQEGERAEREPAQCMVELRRPNGHVPGYAPARRRIPRQSDAFGRARLPGTPGTSRRCGCARQGRARGLARRNGDTRGRPVGRRRGGWRAPRTARRICTCAHTSARSRSEAFTSRTASHGERRPCQSSSASHMFPIPATSRWSSSASPSRRVGSEAETRDSEMRDVRLLGEQVWPEPSRDGRRRESESCRSTASPGAPAAQDEPRPPARHALVPRALTRQRPLIPGDSAR